MNDKLIEQLKRHEGVKLKPYQDTVGKWTIGVGRNLDDIGISEQEAEILLHNDIKEAERQLVAMMPWTKDLDEVRFSALLNFVFNVGIGTALRFVNAMGQLKQGNYDMAANEMLKSKWAIQVGQRAIDVSEQIRTGEWQ